MTATSRFWDRIAAGESPSGGRSMFPGMTTGMSARHDARRASTGLAIPGTIMGGDLVG